MPLHILDNKIWFPDVNDALDDGLLAVGGDLSKERLLLAYRKGIFPWYEDDIPLWWCPHPRFVLFPQKLKVSSSMHQLLRRKAFDFTVNTAFEAVIENCKKIKRKDQYGTWINSDVVKAYTRLHREGYAVSAEAWQDGKLAGGLYGIRMGKVFFGESMFSLVSNASKFAFIKFTRQLIKQDVRLIDCQVYTQHLESLGAEMIDRNEFIAMLEKLVPV
ncbi:MAG TPA: leucyl/phenylalanyl-tRNA--protein transferase [Chitinophagaceae bacterium]|nr:leucyl/phenylalanyl-tRNA--protein transferase [Chitinophagaceae bacterium]